MIFWKKLNRLRKTQMEKIEDRIGKILESTEFKMSNSQRKAKEQYQKLLNEGVIQKPYYSLMGIERYTRART